MGKDEQLYTRAYDARLLTRHRLAARPSACPAEEHAPGRLSCRSDALGGREAEVVRRNRREKDADGIASRVGMC